MKPSALVIRADANVVIGTGHVMRCLALGEAWQDAGGTATFVTAEMPERLEARVTASGFPVRRIEAVPASAADAEATLACAREVNADWGVAKWIVVDGDRFGSDFVSRLRDASFRVLLLDDFAERESYPADLIVNPNLGADANQYTLRGLEAPILTGPRYALLRREFRRPVRRSFGEKRSRILITLGGSDPENLTPRIAGALVECGEIALTIVAGPGYRNTAELKKRFAGEGARATQSEPSRSCKVVEDPESMAELMADADLAIIAAGGTLWELLASGCVVLSYSRNSVQARVIEMLARDGVVADMGATSKFNPARLVAEVKRLAESGVREEMARRGQALIDGDGAERVVAAMRRGGESR